MNPCWAAPRRPTSPRLAQPQDQGRARSWRRRQRRQWFKGWGSLHVWSRVPGQHRTCRQDVEAVFAPGGRGRLPVIGGSTSGRLIGYQGNQQRGTRLTTPLDENSH